MIRKLDEFDQPALEALLDTAPEHNLYARGNLNVLGLDAPFCEFFGEVGADGQLVSVSNRYFGGWTIYGLRDADWAGHVALMEAHPDSNRLQDNPGGVGSVLPFLQRLQPASVDVETLMRLDDGALVAQPLPDGVQVRRATLDDLPALVALYRDAGDMSRTPTGVERPLRDTRVYLAEVEGQVAAAALTNAETAAQAMVGGVYTPPNWRGRGLAGAVCSALCAALQAEQKTPVLYWKNPAAGAVYARMGFREIGVWRAVWLEPRPTALSGA